MLRASILVFLFGCGHVTDGTGDDGDDTPGSSLTITVDPAPHYVRTGAQVTVAVSIARDHVTGPVTIAVEPVAGIASEPITLAGDRGELVLDIDPAAPFTRTQLVVGASATGVTASATLELETIGAPGTLDPTFGVPVVAASDKVEYPVFAIPQGDRVVLGIALARGGKPGLVVVRRLRDGAADPAFGIAGETFVDLSAIGITSVTTNICAAAQPDGRLVIVGSGTNGSDLDPFIARLTADGQLDSTLLPHRVETTTASYSISSLTIGPDGELVAGGARNSGATSDGILLRFDPSGALDPGFGSDGIKIYGEMELDSVAGVVVQADGRIVALISTSHGNTYELAQHALRRFGSDGTLDPSFGTGGKAALPTPEGAAQGSMLVSPDRLTLVVAGSANMTLVSGELAVWRFLADGRLDLGFAGGVGYWRSSAASSFQHVIAATDGSIYAISSAAASLGAPIELRLVHLDAAGALDAGFGSGGITHEILDLVVRAAALRPDHRLVLAASPLFANDANDTHIRSYWH